MRQLEGILFIKGVYWENVVVKESDLGRVVDLDRVEILWHNKENDKWEVLFGSLDKTNEGYIFKEIITGETYKLLLGRVKNKPEEISGFMDFCLGAYTESENETGTAGITVFPELIADYFNGKRQGKAVITGFGTEYREGNCERWVPLVFRNVEKIRYQGFYCEGKFWKITGALRMTQK